MKKIRVLVTGAGSGVGQGIIKSLRLSELPITVIAADISPLNVALYRSDESVIIPAVESSGSLERMIPLLGDLRPDLVMVGSEFDLDFFTDHRELIQQRTGAIVAVPPKATVELGSDKYLTTEFLRTNSLPFAPAYSPTSIAEAVDAFRQLNGTAILKPRRGTSSRNVHFIESEAALKAHFPSTPMPMLQQAITAPSKVLDREYTCSVFKTSKGELLGPFTAKRTLRGGSSWIVEVARFDESMHSLLLTIGRLLDFQGSMNVQLMLDDSGSPIPFEFNSRFSGTTAIRAHFGFNEPEMYIRDCLLKEKLRPPSIREGTVLRYLEEVFIDNAASGDLEHHMGKGTIHQWF